MIYRSIVDFIFYFALLLPVFEMLILKTSPQNMIIYKEKWVKMVKIAVYFLRIFPTPPEKRLSSFCPVTYLYRLRQWCFHFYFLKGVKNTNKQTATMFFRKHLMRLALFSSLSKFAKRKRFFTSLKISDWQHWLDVKNIACITAFFYSTCISPLHHYVLSFLWNTFYVRTSI